MATVEWKYNYKFGGKYRYYGRGTPSSAYDVGLDDFVIDHLNKSRQLMVLHLSNMRRRGEGIVRSRSRVDTGLMKASVTGAGEFGTDVMKISFGWETFQPYYAPFQEFGTRQGITPMLAVYEAYNTVLGEMKSMFGGSN